MWSEKWQRKKNEKQKLICRRKFHFAMPHQVTILIYLVAHIMIAGSDYMRNSRNIFAVSYLTASMVGWSFSHRHRRTISWRLWKSHFCDVIRLRYTFIQSSTGCLIYKKNLALARERCLGAVLDKMPFFLPIEWLLFKL